MTRVRSYRRAPGVVGWIEGSGRSVAEFACAKAEVPHLGAFKPAAPRIGDQRLRRRDYLVIHQVIMNFFTASHEERRHRSRGRSEPGTVFLFQFVELDN